LTREVIIKLAQAGFEQAVLLQTLVGASDQTDGDVNEEAVVVKFSVVKLTLFFVDKIRMNGISSDNKPVMTDNINSFI